MDILIKDNFFENPDLLREIALSIDNYRVDYVATVPPSGWRGERTLQLRSLKNDLLNQCDQKIFDTCYQHFDLSNFKYPYTNDYAKNLTITSFFHVTTERARQAFSDFGQDRYHMDFNTACAGVIYLNPEAPSKAGTSIFDGENNRVINVENKYNRLVGYEGSRVHALTDVFGESRETGRLTYTYFIHEDGLEGFD